MPMSTSLLYHTQGIRDFNHVCYKFHDCILEQTIERKSFCCPVCHKSHVSTYKRGTRIVTGLPCGSKPLWLKFDVHTIYCHDCGRMTPEKIPFLSHPNARITKQLEKTIVDYRSCMSTLAIARYFNLDWHTIRNAQKRYLEKEYKNVSCKNVTAIGVDEIRVGHNPDGTQHYKTIVRDLDQGDVLWVGDGKGESALDGFGKRLKGSGASIKYITMDLGHPFTAWARKNLMEATIVYDHFHVIKLMNDAVDKVRRRVMGELEQEQKESLKKQRYLFLRNQENLGESARNHLEKVKTISGDLGIMHTMKEDLRAIYAVTAQGYEAELQLKQWIENARTYTIPDLTRVAKSIENHLTGITAYWDTGLTNSHMEGFNSKLRGMIKMANGYSDDAFFTLKIYDLPDQKIIETESLPGRRRTLRQQMIFPDSTH